MKIQIKITKSEAAVSAGADELKGTLTLGGRSETTTIEVAGMATIRLDPGVTCDGTLSLEKSGTGYSPVAKP